MSVSRKHSPPGAMPSGDPAFGQALERARQALWRAVADFEQATGRTVDSIHLHHIDVTMLCDAARVFEREANLAWLPTADEQALDAACNAAWRRYLAGEGPRP